jgi:hypothetical protein
MRQADYATRAIRYQPLRLSNPCTRAGQSVILLASKHPLSDKISEAPTGAPNVLVNRFRHSLYWPASYRLGLLVR